MTAAGADFIEPPPESLHRSEAAVGVERYRGFLKRLVKPDPMNEQRGNGRPIK